MSGNRVLILGAGTMGSGIAHVFALNNYNVELYDIKEAILDNAINIINKNLMRQINKEVISELDAKTAIERITTINNIKNISTDPIMILEAVYENLHIKREILNAVNERINSNAIFASNTSAISITKLGKDIRPEKFIGLHFMNPVPLMKLVEVIRGYLTSEETVERSIEIITSLGKVPIETADYPGFISNRILMPMINEAIFALYENVADVNSIDEIMKLGMRHPMGPLELADYIGLDVCLAIMNVLYEGFKDSKYRPCPLLVQMVEAGILGRKTNIGFYEYKG